MMPDSMTDTLDGGHYALFCCTATSRHEAFAHLSPPLGRPKVRQASYFEAHCWKSRDSKPPSIKQHDGVFQLLQGGTWQQ